MAKGPDFETAAKMLGRHVDKYHLALGRFVSAFSGVEAMVLRVLWALARLRSPYAQAVLSGVRIEGAMGLINRIADSERWSDEKRAKCQHLFSQLGLINKLRNDVLHYGAGIHGDFWLVSNRMVAHHEDRVREIHITPKTLDDAGADLGIIHTQLVFLAGGRTGIMIFGEKGRLRSAPPLRAWRYRQPPQADWLDSRHKLTGSKCPRVLLQSGHASGDHRGRDGGRAIFAFHTKRRDTTGSGCFVKVIIPGRRKEHLGNDRLWNRNPPGVLKAARPAACRRA